MQIKTSKIKIYYLKKIQCHRTNVPNSKGRTRIKQGMITPKIETQQSKCQIPKFCLLSGAHDEITSIKNGLLR